MNEEATDPKTIVLARLLQGNADAPIHIQLDELTLTSSPTYSCISFVPSGTKKEIYHEGRAYLLDSALVDALRAVRSPDADILIWAEGITTDLSGSSEPSISPSVFRTALLNAQDVRVWVGKGDPNTKKAIRLLQDLAEQWRTLTKALELPDNWSQARPQQLMDVVKSVQQLVSAEATPFAGLNDSAIIESANMIASAPYFRHVRAIPSIVLAKKAVVTTDESAMLWMDYCDSLNLIAASGGLLPIKCDIVHMQLVNEIRIAVRRWRGDNQSLELLPMVQQSRKADCHDARERISALLPIISPSKRVVLGHGIAQPPLEVNQSVSQEQIFLDAARHIIGERQDLLLWNDIPPSSKPSRLASLPSWVPDWSDASNVPSLKLRPSMALRSWEGAPCVQSVQDPLEIKASGALKAQVHIFGRVTEVSTRPFTDENFHNLVLDNIQLLPPTESLHKSDDFPRTLMLDQWPTGNVSSPTLLKAWTSFAARCQILKTLGVTPEEFNADPSAIVRALPAQPEPWLRDLWQLAAKNDISILNRGLMNGLGRRFFVLDNGYLGMGFHEEDGWSEEHRVREGDIIAVFVGGYFPYILRNWEHAYEDEDDDDEGAGVRYKLMGEAHVQGLMEAEALKDHGWIISTWKDVEIQEIDVV